MVLTRRQWIAACSAAVLLPSAQAAPAFDHSHAAWNALLQAHVVLLPGKNASQLRYAGMLAQRAEVQRYIQTLSAVTKSEFDAFSAPQQMAFLINAYNACTVDAVLTRYPQLQSIKDLGSLLSSPWKKRSIALLGQTVSLDDIEHGMLRKRGVYDDPRVHFAVNCASVGCPMLREEAYVAPRLDAQLGQQARRFMQDRTRNRWNAKFQRLELSKIFDWYGEDFKLGHQGIHSLTEFAALHADALADSEADRARLRTTAVPIAYLDYDWSLNDARPAP